MVSKRARATTAAVAGLAVPQAVATKVLAAASGAVAKPTAGDAARLAKERRDAARGTIAKPTMRRMIRRAGIYRVSTKSMQPLLVEEFDRHLDELVQKSVLYTQSGQRKLVTLDDVSRAYLLVDGRKIAGVEDTSAGHSGGVTTALSGAAAAKKSKALAGALAAAAATAAAAAKSATPRKKKVVEAPATAGVLQVDAALKPKAPRKKKEKAPASASAAAATGVTPDA